MFRRHSTPEGEGGRGVFPEKTPRILVSGCPQPVTNWKLPMIVENASAVIVGEESCVGERGTRNLTNDSGDTVDEMMEAIVNRYVQVDCAIFTPNPDRLDHIQQMVADYKADGVLHYGLQFCQPYLMESMPVEKALEEQSITCLRIETDYSMKDVGQLKKRVEAFVEQLRVIRRAAGMINRVSTEGDIVFRGSGMHHVPVSP